MIGVILENGMIEFGDLLAAWPIPELKDRRYQPDARHVIRKSILGQQIERGGMGRGRPWIRLQSFVDVEYSNREATTPEQPAAQQADRPTSGNQYPSFFRHTRTAVYCRGSDPTTFRATTLLTSTVA